MNGSGPVTLSQVERALEELGGQATFTEILDQVTKLRNGDYSHYLNWRNYQETTRQVIQDHCLGYAKYRGQARFEKVGNTFRLSSSHPASAQRSQPVPEKLTPRAIDFEDSSQPERVRQEVYRILRDTALARTIKKSHKYQCQICGQTLKLSDGTPYAEAHHIVPLGKSHNGPDVSSNILCVCPNDHVLLDYGAIKLDEIRLEGIGKEFIDYHNENIYRKILV
ncbi:MAG: HNH endonuclease [Candidatus Latescibacterota bacterium]